jgi:hypothetical protein
MTKKSIKKVTKARKQTKFQKLIARIERSNKAFSKAGPAEKIVMVASDILELLSLKRINATPGTYVALPEPPGEVNEVSDFLKLPRVPACDVCAIGAAMVAATIRLNRVKLVRDEYGQAMIDAVFTTGADDARMSSGMSRRALSVFPKELLREMEDAFESEHHGYEQFESRDRLRAIYKNLVKNKGRKFTTHDTGEIIWPYRY